MSTKELRPWLHSHWPQIRSQLDAGTYQPQPVRRVMIPKPSGGLRKLGVPAVVDRLICQAIAQVLTPIFDPQFHPSSFGYRPGRSQHDAVEQARQFINDDAAWCADLDLDSFLVPSSHCRLVHGGGVEEGVFGVWDPDSQAFSASVADVDRLELAALDTLQHRLAGDAEGAHRVDDRDVAGGGFFDEQRTEFVVDADSPGSAGGVLLTGDEPVLKPAEDCGCGDAELVGGFADGEQLAVGRFGCGVVGGDAAVAAQSADDDGGEPFAGGGAAALTVED
ncbi:MAG: hypothetical protein LC749_13510, partial [Actinobacteria bacterium]|nr:hypothetical protein [Actinomycetota bacterium]